MGMPSLVVALLLLTARASLAGDWEHAPKPEDYAVHETFQGKPASPKLESPTARLFRTRIREGAKAGPNFAGHFTVVTWGCGLDAFYLVVVNAKTGEVYLPPFGCMALAGGFDLPVPDPLPNPAYRLDSRLLVVVGLEDGKDEPLSNRAVRFYSFTNGKFKFVYSIPAPLTESDSHDEN
jgi:hypothetical protein